MTYTRARGAVIDWLNQAMTTLTNRIPYTSEFNAHKPHDQYTMKYPDGGACTGEWKYNLPNGQGTYTDAASPTYTSAWKYS